MKKGWFTVFLVLVWAKTFAQGIYGFETGGGTVASYGNYYTPTIEATYLKMLFPHVCIGAAVDWRYFSFNFYDPQQQFSDPNYGSIVAINHHSAYLFVSPLIDISIGENQIFHFNFNIGPGVYLYGSESTTYEANSLPGKEVINVINTSNNNNKVIFQYGYGLSEYIPTRGYWSIKLSQQYSVLGRDLNSPGSNAPALRTDYMSFTIGISHYYSKLYYY